MALYSSVTSRTGSSLRSTFARRGLAGAFLSGVIALACSAGEATHEPEGAAEQQAPLTAPALTGFADLHFHMMAEEAFGGGWMHGRHNHPLDDCDGGLPPSDHARVRQDLNSLLQACPLGNNVPLADPLLAGLFGIGGAIGSEAIGQTEGTQGDTGVHLGRDRYPEDWPRWDTLAHQQGTIDMLRAAHRGGLRLAVLSAVSYDWLCSILPEQNRERPCDEMADVDLQLQMMHQLAASQASWLAIARSPQEARQIIGAGKLALVLSIEASHIFGRSVDEAKMLAALNKYYDLGVRTLQPVHQTDNAFGGAALHNKIFHLAQYTENCHVDTDCAATGAGVTLGFDVDANCRNVRGLTSLGKTLVTEMMKRGMLIDAAHMSERTMSDVFSVSRANNYYPVYISHGHFREVMAPKVADTEKSTPAWAISMVRQSGGVFGLRTAHDETLTYTRSKVPNDCQGSSHSFAQAYEFGRQGLKVPMALGGDLNGFIQQVRPRFGDNGACSAAFKAEGDCQAKAQRISGPRRLGTEFDEKGLAHQGLLPDLLADLEVAGVDTSALRNSAENFVRMWERAQSPRVGPADAAIDVDTSGVLPFVPHGAREAAYPTQCGKAYCPSYQTLGGECRFDAECESGQCTAVLCDTIPGRCVCNDDGDCRNGTYCAINVPAVPGDNACTPKLGDHALCSRDTQCQSGTCGGLIAGTGWCYTAGSKSVGSTCHVNEECTTGRCGDVAQTCLCRTDSHCSAGQFCGWGTNDGKCMNKRSSGSLCTTDRECQSNSCRMTFTGPRCR